MPYICKPKKKTRIQSPYKHDNISQKYYNTPQWKNLRNSYIREYPICEVCNMLNITEDYNPVKPSEEVHHIIPFLSMATDEERKDTLLDEDNLIALCKKHHRDIHANRINLGNLIMKAEEKTNKNRRELFYSKTPIII